RPPGAAGAGALPRPVRARRRRGHRAAPAGPGPGPRRRPGRRRRPARPAPACRGALRPAGLCPQPRPARAGRRQPGRGGAGRRLDPHLRPPARPRPGRRPGQREGQDFLPRLPRRAGGGGRAVQSAGRYPPRAPRQGRPGLAGRRRTADRGARMSGASRTHQNNNTESTTLAEIIVVTSGKGGVGKTTTSASIASGLARRGKKTAVIDFDVGLRNLDLIMGCERRVVYDFVNVVQGEASLKQALIKDKRFDNLFILAASQTRDKDALTREGVERVLKELADDGFEYI